jgi:hypothetical protein
MRDEKPTKGITRRLRGVLAEEMVPHIEVGRRIGMTQAAFARRMLGSTPFDVDEIIAVARVTGLRLDWIMTGEGDAFGPDGCAIRDSNPEPADYEAFAGLNLRNHHRPNPSPNRPCRTSPPNRRDPHSRPSSRNQRA